MKYYVYKLITPVKIMLKGKTLLPGTVFYVGKGCGNRYNHHKTDTSRHNELKEAAISRINNSAAEYVVDVTYMETEQDAFNQEIALIAELGRLVESNGLLTNLTEGGEGQSGFRHSQETKDLISRKNKGNIPYNKGIKRPGVGGIKKGTPWSEAARKSQMAARINNPNYAKTNEHRQKLSIAMKGKPGNATNKHWANNGIIEKYFNIDQIPADWKMGRLSKPLIKKRGMLWFNNGIINKQYKLEEAPDEFKRGRIKKKQEKI